MKTSKKIPISKLQRTSKLMKTGAKVGVNYLKYYGDKIVNSEEDAKERLNGHMVNELIEVTGQAGNVKGTAGSIAQKQSPAYKVGQWRWISLTSI